MLDRLDAAAGGFRGERGGLAATLVRRHRRRAPSACVAPRATLLANDRDSFLHCYRVFATADAEIGRGPVRGSACLRWPITGECDPGSTPEMTRRLAEAIPDCRAVVVPGARHMLPVERPRELVDHLSAFIGENAHV